MDLRDWYYKQLVTQGEMDQAFGWAQSADWAQVEDLVFWGIIDQLGVTEEATPDLTVDVAGPGLAYGKDGERIFVASTQNVDCSVDEYGSPTAVVGAGNEKYLSLFVRFARNPQAPEVDGNGLTVYTEQFESYELIVRQGTEAVIPTATAPALLGDAILLADIHLVFGQTQILNADIGVDRREDWVRYSSINFGTVVVGTPKEAVEYALALVDTLWGAFPFSFASTWFGAAPVLGPAPPPTTIQQALDAIVYDIAQAGVGPSGSDLIGVTDSGAFPFVTPWAAADLQSVLMSLAGDLDGHIGGAPPQHPANAITFAPYLYLSSTDVQAAVQELVDDLLNIAGASRVGYNQAAISGMWGVTGATVQAMVDNIVTALYATAPTSGAALIGTAAIPGTPESEPTSLVMSVLTNIYGHLNDRTERSIAEVVDGHWTFDAGNNPGVTKALDAQNVLLNDAPFVSSLQGGSHSPYLNRETLLAKHTLGAGWAHPFVSPNSYSWGGTQRITDICAVLDSGDRRMIAILTTDPPAGPGVFVFDPMDPSVFGLINCGLNLPAPTGIWQADCMATDGHYLYVMFSDTGSNAHQIMAWDAISQAPHPGWPVTGTAMPGVGATPLGISNTDRIIIGSLAAPGYDSALTLVTANSWQNCASGLSISVWNATNGALVASGDGDAAVISYGAANAYPSGGLSINDATGDIIMAVADSGSGAGSYVTATLANPAVGSGYAGMPFDVPSQRCQDIIWDGSLWWCINQTGDIYIYDTVSTPMAWVLKQGNASVGTARFGCFDGFNVWLQDLEASIGQIVAHKIPASRYAGNVTQTVAVMATNFANFMLSQEAGDVAQNQMGRMAFDGDAVWMVMSNVGGMALSGIVRRLPAAVHR